MPASPDPAHSAPASPDGGAALSAPAPAREMPREIVLRPDGMRRGVWEAPTWFFPTFTGVLVVAAALYGARRMGWLRRKGAEPTPSSRGPSQSRQGRPR